jgi:tRNA A37 methylthiotransferase MiaB
VNIEEGCLDACAFCSTHLVKGRLHSFSPNDIVDQVQALVDDGCLEIQLTGQDCACYGFDIGTNLAELTQRILTHVNGNYRIRLGMGNPRHVLGYQEALLDCFTDERIYKFIHIPVQSGSENVLKAMNRRHTARDYATLAHAFNERFDKFTLSTDLIVGYPGETAADFNDTLTLLKETRPTVCNITRFVARPGTVAARLEAASATRLDASNSAHFVEASSKEHLESAINNTNFGFATSSPHHASTNLAIPDAVKHERSAILAEAFQQIALENNRKWIGDECIVVTEKRGHRIGTTIARNTAYRPVALQGSFPAGQTLRVRIKDAEPFALIADLQNI